MGLLKDNQTDLHVWHATRHTKVHKYSTQHMHGCNCMHGQKASDGNLLPLLIYGTCVACADAVHSHKQAYNLVILANTLKQGSPLKGEP